MATNPEAFREERWRSPEYVDWWINDQVREADRKLLRRKLTFLIPFESEASLRVLDVGGGAGGVSMEILTAYPNCTVVCQDFSEAMLGHARRSLAQFSERVTFVMSDLRDSTWSQIIDGSFDAVVTCSALHNVPGRIREIYREVFSLVNSGGCFLNCDLVPPPGPMLARIYLKNRLAAYRARIKEETGVDKSLEEIEKEWRERRSHYAQWPGGTERGFRISASVTNHLEWLSQAGFDEVDCLWKDACRTIIGGFKR